jgi:uncharacterized membrane protein
LQWQFDVNKTILVKDYAESLAKKEFELFSRIWLSIYSMFYLFMLSYFNIKKIKNYYLGWINMALDAWVLFFFVTVVCFNLYALQDTNFHPAETISLHRNGFSAFIRYISYASGALMVFSLSKYIIQEFINPTKLKLQIIFDIMLHIFLITIASYQLIHFFFLYTNDPLLGKYFLSVLWGIYALVLIILGIAKHQKHIRVIAIVLFSITLFKLFVYDTERLGTISKTVLFVSLGVLLLIVSYLYNKYKSKLLEDSNVE